MNRALAILVCLACATGCSDDQVVLERGPLGPATYEVEVRASGEATEVQVHRTATLGVQPLQSGAFFSLRTSTGETIETEVNRLEDGSVALKGVRGPTRSASGETELASLVGQLDPPLPRAAVRLGEGWSSTQRITTETLTATLRTELAIVRFRRIAGTDAAELEGQVSGRLRTSGPTGSLDGTLQGRTSISWAVELGRVAAASTHLVWTLEGGDQVTLETTVRPG